MFEQIGIKLWNILEKTMYFFAVKVFHLRFLERNWEQFLQFVRFGLVGVSNTLIHYVVYLICVMNGMHYIVSNILGFVISVSNSFYWNNKYVFKKKEGEERSLVKSYFKTVLSYAGTGLVLSNVLLILWVDVVHISAEVAPLINLFITIPLNYIINKLWAFKAER